MQRPILWIAAFAIICGVSTRAEGGVITFDDLTTRDNFFALGIESTYEGFEWGYSRTPGLAGAVLPANNTEGWASSPISDPAVNPPPTPVSGNTAAWNWDGPQSLIIDFQTPHDVNSAYFATLSASYSSNADTVQMFGYDASNNLIATSSVLNLTDSFQQLTVGFTNIRTLEIRANATNRWFSVDDLDVMPSSMDVVPEPASLAVFGFAAVGLTACGIRRRKRRQA